MPMNIASRPATEADVPHLARLCIAAFAGLMDAAYAGSLAELPLEKIIEWRFVQRGSIRSYEHCLIALCRFAPNAGVALGLLLRQGFGHQGQRYNMYATVWADPDREIT